MVNCMSSIEKAIEKYQDLRHLVLSHDFTVSEYKEINYGLQFLVSKSEWSGTVRIYQNNQGRVKTDFSQLDNSSYSRLITSLFDNQISSPLQVEKSTLPRKMMLPVIGSDESGKGDYFGSLVSACIYVDEKISDHLEILGVKDSKTLSDSKVLKIAKDIQRNFQDKFIIIEISPERYNEIYAELENKKQSLNDLLAWAHAKGIEELLSKVECKTAIVDQFANENLLMEKLQEKGKQLTIIQAHRAESHIAVAAASILARDRFINKIKKLENQYQIKIPKGASKEVIDAAKQLVSKHGIGILSKVAKLHFKTTQEVLN